MQRSHFGSSSSTLSESRKMGAGASNVKTQLAEAKPEDLTAAVKELSPEEVSKLKAALDAAGGSKGDGSNVSRLVDLTSGKK